MAQEKNWPVEAAIFAFAFLSPELAAAQSAPTAPEAAPAVPTPAAPAANETTLPPVIAHEARAMHPKPAIQVARKPAPSAHASHRHPQIRAASSGAGKAGLASRVASESAPSQPAQLFTPNYGAPIAAQGPVSPPSMASQMTISGKEINAVPVTRPGEILELVPGLIVTQHSGEGKANQYFLRGYNLDHGTDMSIWVDDVPINLRTHAHGQGYSDLNWLMPETVNSVAVRKGPYFADESDFASAGNLRIGLIDTAPTTVKYIVGSFGYIRLFGMGSSKLGEGNLLAAGVAVTYNGNYIPNMSSI